MQSFIHFESSYYYANNTSFTIINIHQFLEIYNLSIYDFYSMRNELMYMYNKI